MRIRDLLIDIAGHPQLLRLRESARAAVKWVSGIGLRVALLGKGSTEIPGLLSVVVPAYGVEAYIHETLVSLSRQNYRKIEVIVIDDGSLDRSGSIARRYTWRDPRVRVFRQENAGLGAARNAGIARARGEYLAFLDSDDTVDRHVYTDAIDALRSSGSDFSLSPYRRMYKTGFPSAAPWVLAAHERRWLGCTLAEFPDAQVNAVAWSKVYRRSFWDETGLEFPIGVHYEDQAASSLAFAAADSFDVLSHVSINWRIRDDQSSISQQVVNVRNINDQALAARESLDVLQRFGHEAARQARLAQLLSNNLSEFLLLIRDMTNEAWAAFVQLVRDLNDAVVDKDVWNHVDARNKILIHYVLHDDRTAAIAFLDDGGWQRERWGAAPDGDGLYLTDLDTLNVSSRTRRLSVRESSAVVKLSAARANDTGITLDLAAFIEGLAEEYVPHVDIALRRSDDGECTPLKVTRRDDPSVCADYATAYNTMSSAAVGVMVPFDALSGDGDYSLTATLTYEDVRAETIVAFVQGRAVPATSSTPSGAIIDIVADESRSLIIRRYTPRFRVESIQAESRAVTLTIEGDQISRAALIRADDRFGLRRFQRVVTTVRPRMHSVRLPLPQSPRSSLSTGHPGRTDWLVQVRDEHGRWQDIHLSAFDVRTDLGSGYAITMSPHSTPLAPSRGAALRISDWAGREIATDVRLGEATLEVVYRSNGDISESMTARESSSDRTLAVALSDSTSETAFFPLREDRWGLGLRPIALGAYTLAGASAGGSDVLVDDALASRLPLTFRTPELRLVVRSDASGRLVIHVHPPLDDHERGHGNQVRMQVAYRKMRPEPPRSVVFRSLYGDAANDSALAVHRELRRRGSDLRLIWAVRDLSLPIPEGGIPVLEGSEAYYSAIGHAQYVMVNVHQPDWMIGGDDQVVVQTFHGYPFKMNGRRWWKKLGFASERIHSFYRRAKDWDYLVSPASYATQHLREFYEPDTPIPTRILEIGYPRNDVLVSPDAESLRLDTRRGLGIPEGSKTILYAPTFRDYLSADDMSAAFVAFLDYERLLRALGDNATLLVRGHPFNRRAGTRTPDGVINVTDYPDINDLILASDAAILDYSSLRFDYALSRRPMVFFVPDEKQYFRGRESFASYAETSPGPHVATTAEVARALRDLPAITKRYAPAVAEFRSRYMELEDGRAAARLVDEVFVPRGDA